jgi:hypothetical protein
MGITGVVDLKTVSVQICIYTQLYRIVNLINMHQ